MLKRARRMGKSWHLWTSKHAKNNKYINTFSLTHFLFLRLIIKLLWHELLQTSILATDWWEVSKFVTCLWILLILLDLFFIFADGGGWWVGSKNWLFFVDVINGWPLNYSKERKHDIMDFSKCISCQIWLIHQKTKMFKYEGISVLCTMIDHINKMILQLRQSIYQVYGQILKILWKLWQPLAIVLNGIKVVHWSFQH